MSHAGTNPLDLIELERRRDRLIRRVSIAAWALTFVTVGSFAGIIAMRLVHLAQLVAAGAGDRQALWEAAVPLVVVLGVLSLLVAVLATVGVFLRLRTASLVEIQLRLAALEAMLAERMAGDAR
jgi:hypothetical protein